ncbi:hypothetical protein EX30DRAFT_40645 [Ascodesmis nigricans]|uniref:Uncharacterized protein n=1 Tax=Ascodesmis nigricans TaxID=341454 RepID=A0A4S2MW18_9PEZI|nr:hypothetical protein EX30DRAFT_40645 [Ascodesmis nigricans]
MPLRSFFRAKDASEAPGDPTQDDDGQWESQSKSNRSSFINTLKRTVERFSTSARNSRASTPVPDTAADDRPSTEPSQTAAPPEPPCPTTQTSSRRSRPSTRTSIRRQKNPSEKTAEKQEEQVIAGPLSDDDLQRLFCGAPEFSLAPNSEGELEPRVTYPHGLPQGAASESLKDYRSSCHPAYELTTVRDQDEFIVETPSMKSAFGSEPGTSGWEYYLMLPIGDSERPIDEVSDDTDEAGRERGAPGDPKGGVRSVEVGYLAERLKELGSIWHTRKKRREGPFLSPNEDEEKATEPTTVELYSHLFSRILFPPTRVTTEDYLDPYSLRVQILSLVGCLSKKMWLDFGNVSWRIKLGQIIWGDVAVEDEYDDTSLTSNETEKVWLLLQLLLASELLLRLDSVLNDEATLTTAPGSTSLTRTQREEALLSQIRSMGGSKVLWDLVLARRWLENIKIIEPDTSQDAAPTPPPTSRWFGSISPAPTTPSNPSTPASSPSDISKITDALLVPRHANRQIDGLLQFSRRLQWPNTDRLAQQMLSKRTPIHIPPASIYNGSSNSTPISTIASSSYFPDRPRAPPTLHHKRSILAIPTAESSGGWLSRSYLTGLLLPGEGLPHLIMSTLLENDAAAVEALGFNANLYGGFQYKGSTWWSRHCILSRVLAGYCGAVDECGWVGPAIPSGVGAMGRIADGWVDVVVEPPPDDTARALTPDRVWLESRINPPAPEGSTPPAPPPSTTEKTPPTPKIPISTTKHPRQTPRSPRASLSKPPLTRSPQLPSPPTPAPPPQQTYTHLPQPPTPHHLVEVRGLHFTPLPPLNPTPSDDPEDQEFPRYHAAIHFLIGLEQKIVDINYDVAFVSAWPCFAGPHRIAGGYKARWVDVGDLVLGVNNVKELELEPENAGDETGKRKEVKLLRFVNPEMRVLALAWCAMVGEDAVVMRRGRTCVACAVREAGALGIRVVVVC